MDKSMKLNRVVVMVLGLALALGPVSYRVYAATPNSRSRAAKVSVVPGEAALSPEAKAAAEKVRAAGVGFLTAQALMQKIKSGRPPIIVDVLGASSYNAKHLKGAISIPYNKVDEIAPQVLPDKGAEIVAYCAGYLCGASLTAAKSFKGLGYTNIHDFKGGLQEWAAHKLPFEGSDAGST